MRIAAYALAVVLALLVWTTWGPRVAIAGVAPDPVLVVIVAAAVLRGVEAGSVVGALGGFAQDLATGGPLGLHALVGLLVGAGVGLVRGSLYLESALLPLAAALVATAGAALLEGALLAITDIVHPAPEALARAALIAGCYNMAVAPVVFAALRRMDAWLARREAAG